MCKSKEKKIKRLKKEIQDWINDYNILEKSHIELKKSLKDKEQSITMIKNLLAD